MIINKVTAVKFFISGLLICFAFHSVIADDPGITKVRLIQQTDTSYTFEADVPQLILPTIKKPVLPERFDFTNFELKNQSGWITLQTTIYTSGKPFGKEDEILLPWLRNGVDFTAQWKDGGTYKGLFNRSLKGIHIPIADLMPTELTTSEVLLKGLGMGLKHIKFKFIHILFIVTLALSFVSRKNIAILLWWSLGQGLAMLFIELGLTGIDMLYADLLTLLLTFLMALTIANGRRFQYLWIALLVAGTIHGLSFAIETEGMGFSDIQKAQGLFAFNLVTDVFNYGLAGIILVALPWVKKKFNPRNFGILTGGICTMLFLIVFAENISSGNLRILSNSVSSSRSVRLPAPSKQSLQPVQRGKGLMTAPIMAYLSVEPFEIRQEVLLEAGAVIEAIYPDFKEEFIPVNLQERIKRMLLDTLLQATDIIVDDRSIQMAETNANFVRLSRGGVSIRENLIQEQVSDGIIGITIIYDIPSFPESIEYQWNFFPGDVKYVESSIVDPYGTLTAELSSEDRGVMQWKNRLSGFEIPAVEPIHIVTYPLPWAAFILWLIICIYLFYFVINRRQIKYKPIVIVLIGVGFVIYPFLRTESNLPFIPQWKPSEERSTNILNDLLTNVYRAFDRRKEDDVYDRLAMSVTGEQLTEIYLDNRQAMALENRGGARANVDEVNILKVFGIEHAEEIGFTADASWTVRGSVNHYGHTHYRQNQYRALVTFVDVDNVWKIKTIETIEEKRIY